MHVYCGRDSVFIWRRCDMLHTSGFVDDVIFSHNVARHGHIFKRRERTSRKCCIDSKQIWSTIYLLCFVLYTVYWFRDATTVQKLGERTRCLRHQRHQVQASIPTASVIGEWRMVREFRYEPTLSVSPIGYVHAKADLDHSKL